MISIVVPVLDEAAVIETTLAALGPLRAQGAEVVVVDGGSHDATKALAAAWADTVIDAPRGRATQMNAGARRARGDILVFLHADTLLPEAALRAIQGGMQNSRYSWGRFDVAIAGADPLLTVVATLMNARSRLSGIATGDQAIFARRAAFEAAGGLRRFR